MKKLFIIIIIAVLAFFHSRKFNNFFSIHLFLNVDSE